MQNLRLFAAAVLIAGAAACATTPPVRDAREWEASRGLLVPRPLVPFQAAGSALIDYRGERESGNIHLEGTAEQDFLLRLSAKIIGTTALELHFNERAMLVLDYSAETYFAGENSAQNRLRLFSIDMTPAEFLTTLTGRVPREAFERGGGTLIGGSTAEYRADGATYRFTLGADGLPTGWTKEAGGTTVFRVEYRAYMRAETAGAELRVPRKIRVYVDEPRPRLVLGIREFRPWRDNERRIEFAVDPGSGLRFQPLDGDGGIPPAAR